MASGLATDKQPLELLASSYLELHLFTSISTFNTPSFCTKTAKLIEHGLSPLAVGHLLSVVMLLAGLLHYLVQGLWVGFHVLVPGLDQHFAT